MEATEWAVALAEKSGNLGQLVSLTISKCVSVVVSGDLPLATALADQALDLALRGGTRGDLAFAHTLHILGRYRCGDLVGVEQHFADGLKFFGDPGFRQFPGLAVAAFGVGSYTAWALGRAGVASERQSQMMKIAETPYDVAMSAQVVAQLLIYEREYEQAESWRREVSLSPTTMGFATSRHSLEVPWDMRWLNEVGHLRA